MRTEIIHIYNERGQKIADFIDDQKKPSPLDVRTWRKIDMVIGLVVGLVMFALLAN